MKQWKFTNSWKVPNKQWGKIAVKVRVGKITLLDLFFDFGKWAGGLTVMNFGVRKNNRHA